MNANVNLQVWLETVPDTHPSVVVPYVRSETDGVIQYQLKVSKRGFSGVSNLGQSGDVRVQAGQPAALSRFSLNIGKNDECTIELVLFNSQHPADTYHFDCPR
ncbi:hypothetical protein H0A71_13755 [Alcaligenaceae bacterium]|nr:hypothetical protein [Alcaligenaceae bacterium]